MTARRDAQRAWLKFQEANRRFYDDPAAVRVARVNANNANDGMLQTTTERASALTAAQAITQ